MWQDFEILELRILESIRNGDLNSLKQSLDEKFIGSYGTMAKDKIRSSKNVAICHICLSSRAAIDGGISSEVAFSICDNFVRKLASSVGVKLPMPALGANKK